MGSINHTAIMSAEPLAVWHVLRRFGSVEVWHPEVTRSVIQDGGTSGDGGSVRTLDHSSGEVTHERLLAINNDLMTIAYRLGGREIPLGTVTAAIEVHAMPYSSHTLLRWTVDFDTDGEYPASECEARIGDFVLSGLTGLAQYLGADLEVAAPLSIEGAQPNICHKRSTNLSASKETQAA